LLDVITEQLDQKRLAHAYVIEGNAEEQLKAVAHEFAKSLLCSGNRSQSLHACGHCKSCDLFAAGTHPDFSLLGIESGTIGVDEVRVITGFLSHTSQLGGAQVVVVQSAEKMTENAANAILKTLEEPSDNSYLLLLTDSRNKLLPTIRSRCQFLAIPKQSRESLQQAFPDVPEYVYGFVNDNQERVEALMANGQVEQLSELYNGFIQSLRMGRDQLTHLMTGKDSDLVEPFIVYLMQRRARQLLIKGSHDGALKVMDLLAQHHKQFIKQLGLNRSLAMANLLKSGLPLLR